MKFPLSLTDIVGVICSILASCLIARYTFYQYDAGIASSSILNLFPILLKVPSGRLMPCETFQNVTYHFLQQDYKSSTTALSLICIGIVFLSALCSIWFAADNIKEEQLWKKVPSCSLQDDISSFNTNKLPSFVKQTDVVVTTVKEHEVLDGKTFVKLTINGEEVKYRRLKPAETIIARLNEKDIVLTIMCIVSALHCIFTGYFYSQRTKMKMSKEQSYAWIIIGAMFSSPLVPIYGGNFATLFFKFKIEFIKLIPLVFWGIYWIALTPQIIGKKLITDEAVPVKEIWPVLFVVSTSIWGCYLNDEWKAIRSHTGYVISLAVLAIAMIVYIIIAKPPKELTCVKPGLKKYASRKDKFKHFMTPPQCSQKTSTNSL